MFLINIVHLFSKNIVFTFFLGAQEAAYFLMTSLALLYYHLKTLLIL